MGAVGLSCGKSRLCVYVPCSVPMCERGVACGGLNACSVGIRACRCQTKHKLLICMQKRGEESCAYKNAEGRGASEMGVFSFSSSISLKLLFSRGTSFLNLDFRRAPPYLLGGDPEGGAKGIP